ncbi:hypothetical protein GTA08_BOTSDO03640 [Neofusicoccum parvum]|uniref:Uncharacterized protein n=2 Tax=Neofusicoccum parvum TaxID=310453 RepID=R1GB70_BOTPV|nr:hypothetical protein UCRNP2_4424 [Neofusicoccum parvum UCRNP2]GME26203.1 hypothetical protein GTA08_BOTSDO03640 [Neofusicoccum parvum]GME38092.1 hypothetical protein GTA08_BOTSDO03640 [Neofusicoccum parvum]
MASRALSLRLALSLLLSFYLNLAHAVSSQEPLKPLEARGYAVGEAVPVTCLNRTVDTGEHITDASGQLQYIPFPVCNETGKPLELYFGIEKEMNCTIDFISDPLFHLLEFYVHNDAPLTCRIPARPLSHTSSSADSDAEYSVDAVSEKQGAMGAQSAAFTPLIIALTGTLQLSHLHISNHLNVLLHAAPKSVAPGTIDAGTAYSVSHASRNTKIVIGDSLPLRLSVRWYPSPTLPSGWTGVGGHIYMSTVVYCMLSAGAATAVCFAWFRGVELPRRLKRHGKDRAIGVESGRGYNGYGLGVGGGYGYAGGKRD